MAPGDISSYASSFLFSNASPEMSGKVLAVVIGLFDISAVLSVNRIFYEASQSTFTLDKFLKVYLFVSVFILLA